MRFPSYLKRSRHGVFYFRLVVPTRFRLFFGGAREFKRSLRVCERAPAIIAARALSAQVLALFRDFDRAAMPPPFDPKDPSTWHLIGSLPQRLVARVDEDNRPHFEIELDPNIPNDHANAMEALREAGAQLRETMQVAEPERMPQPAAPAFRGAPATVAPTSGPLFSELITESMTIRGNREGTHREYGLLARRFVAKVGDLPIRAISREQIGEYIVSLRKELKPGTVAKHFTAIKAVFEYAQECGKYPAGELPTEKLFKIKKGKSVKVAHKTPFSLVELKVIFSPTTYAFRKPHEFWCPLIGLFSGARISEIAQLELDDIQCHDTLWCFHFRASDEDDEHDATARDPKQLKTEASTRTIPIHPQLLDLGLLDYVADVRKIDGAKGLFPYLKGSVHSGFGKNPSRAFSNYLKQIGIKKARNGTHSFRFMVNDLLKQSGIELEKRCAYLGHEYDSVNSTNYSSPLNAWVMWKKVIPHIEYPGLHLAPLKYVRGSFVAVLGKEMRRVKSAASHAAARARPRSISSELMQMPATNAPTATRQVVGENSARRPATEIRHALWRAEAQRLRRESPGLSEKDIAARIATDARINEEGAAPDTIRKIIRA